MRMFLASWLADKEVGLNDMSNYSLTMSDMGEIPWLIATDRDPASLSYEDVIQARPHVHMILADQTLREKIQGGAILGSGRDVFVKTHNTVAEMDGVSTINAKVTLGAIYIVRDPRDVAVSYASHYGIEIDDAIKQMESHTELRKPGLPMFHYVGPWSDHVTSWCDVDGNVVVLRYEDMLENPTKCFRKVLKAFGLPAHKARVERAANRVSFARLSAAESKFGFKERLDESADQFFRSGKAGGWANTLNKGQVARIEAVHGPVMRRFGYEMAA